MPFSLTIIFLAAAANAPLTRLARRLDSDPRVLRNHYVNSPGRPQIKGPPKLSPANPPWRVTRMTGRVGGAAP
jgi:hypothetical protein